MVVGMLFLVVGSWGAAQETPLNACSYQTTEEAASFWKPGEGCLPVRVETQEEGARCLAFDVEFGPEKARACWDWLGPLDLSQADYVVFEICATDSTLGSPFGLYFGTDNGWYGRTWPQSYPETWVTEVFRLDQFGAEEKPDGWDKITKLRFSVWAAGPGKATYRLRNMRVLPKDPAENLLRNGSFEISCVGVPYGWGSGHWGVGDLPWAADMNLWRARWNLDSAEAKDGGRSLRIINTPDLPRLRAVSVWVTVKKETPALTLSAWVKSDQDELPVTLDCGGASTQAKAGKSWQQVVLRGIGEREHIQATVAPGAPGTLWVDAVQLQAAEAPSEEFHPHHLDARTAERTAAVDWSPPRRVPEVAAGRQIGGPLTTATLARIDDKGRFLLGDTPYVQHSFGLEFVSNLDVLNAVAQAGFKDICIQIRGSITTDELKGILDRCAETGLHIIPWLDGGMTREQFTEHINALKSHPALLCWYVYDEPSGDRFAEADARVNLAHELDPNHPAFVNYLPDKLTEQTGDIYSTDVYPIPHGRPMAAINAVRTMKAAAMKENKPVWMWLQGTGFAYWMDREPSPRELSCMAYGSLIEGARGLYYFAQMPRTKECFDEMRALCVEVEALAPALYSLDAAPEVTCDTPSVLCKAFAQGNEITLLAVNTSDTTRTARLTLPQRTGEAEVLFEGRKVTVENGTWPDSFGAYERHVYRLP